MADITRILVYNPQDVFITDLSPNTVFERLRTEVVNGEHSLTLTTTVKLAKEQRILTCDATGKWREYVVVGEDAEHTSGKRAVGTYYVTWSLQHDLQVTTVSGVGSMPGIQTPVSAAVALAAALSGTNRWSVGTVTQSTTGGASMDNMSGWEALGVLVKVWGGEVDANITVDSLGVVTRSVDLLSHLGAAEALRRFDYARDLLGIRRKVSEDPLCCRIIPLGKGEETESGGYGRKITIASVNGGVNYLQNDNVAELYRLPDGQDGFEYPTLYVENSEIDDKNELKAWGLSVLDEWTLPKVTYEASVLQLAQAGMDIQGIGLGDEVQCVDRAFSDDGLRITGRVVKLVTNELDPSDVRVTIGNLGENLQDVFIELKTSLSRTRDVALAAHAGTLTTAEYLSNILDNLNQAINANGGFAYVTDGHGILTYDCAVSDPLVGAEAHQAVEIKGGSIRIANSKTAQGAWNWETVFVAGHVASTLVTAANITAGYIGSVASGNFWDLDNGELTIAAVAGSTVDGKAIATQDAVISSVDVEYAKGDSPSIAPASGWSTSAPAWESEKYIWQRTATTNQAGTASYSTPTCIQGAQGAPGQNGTDGTDGADGVGISAIEEQYYLSTSSSTQAGGSWSTSQPAWKSGKYIWTRSHITWTNNTTTDTSPVLAQAINGANQSAKDANDAVDTLDNSLDQNEVFKRLTNNQANQGIYLYQGQVYVNASMIAAGTIDAARINAAQLIAGKVGNSANDYASIGTIQYAGENYSGLSLTTDGNVGTLVQGVRDDATGTRYIHAVGLPNDYGYWPFMHFTQGAFTFTGYPVLGTDNIYTAVTMTMNNTYGLQCTMQGGYWAWSNQLNSTYHIRYTKSVSGIVMIQTDSPVTIPAGNSGTQITLSGTGSSAGDMPIPSSARPKRTIYQNVYCGGQCVIQINTDGAILLVRQANTVIADLNFFIAYARQ